MHSCICVFVSFFHVCPPDLSRWQDVVHVLKEGLVFDFVVSKDEADAFAMLASCSVQTLQVIHQVGCVVWAGKEHNASYKYALQCFFLGFCYCQTKKNDREKETVWGCVFVSVCSTSITVWINLTVWIIWVRSDVLFELRAPSQCAIVHHLYFSDSSGIHVASRNLLWLNYFEQLSANLALNMDILYGVLWWKQWGQKKWITHCLVTELCACVYVCANMERCHLDFQVGRAFISGTGKEKVWTDWQISGLKGGEEASNVLAACFQMCLHLFFLCLCVNLNEL